jgi:hypothetical protein
VVFKRRREGGLAEWVSDRGSEEGGGGNKKPLGISRREVDGNLIEN